MVGYDGPIYMTHPTQAICPILLEDYRKIAVDKKGEANFFTSQMIKDCMKKVVAVRLHQTVQVSARPGHQGAAAGGRLVRHSASEQDRAPACWPGRQGPDGAGLRGLGSISVTAVRASGADEGWPQARG